MDQSNLAEIILESMDSLAYVCDIDNDTVLYMNKATREALGLSEEAEYLGKPCYKVLQGRDEPCPFCTNNFLKTDSFYVWDHYNELMERHFRQLDKRIQYEGKLVRLEIATDITEKEQDLQELKTYLTANELLLFCINMLRDIEDQKEAMGYLIENLGAFWQADRVSIFEIDYLRKIAINTYEWCGEGQEPAIDNLQEIPLDAVEELLERLQSVNNICINASDAIDASRLTERQIKRLQEFMHMITVPMFNSKNAIVGVIGIDNPQMNLELIQQLCAIAKLVADDIEKRQLRVQLERISYEDILTGLCNRNGYAKRIQELQKQPLRSLGVAYFDIDGLKEANDLYGHSCGDRLIVSAASVLKKIFAKDIFRVGGDEFVVFCKEIDKEEFEGLIRSFRKEIQKEGVKISIGADWVEENTNILEQIIRADELMYVEKKQYRQSAAKEESPQREALEDKLQEDILQGEYIVLLQPKVDMDSLEVVEAEALIRKKGEKDELIPPVSFIPFYEKQQLIHYIDFFVLDKMCRLLSEWEKKGEMDIRIAVNISYATFQVKNAADRLIEICKKHDVSPCRIVLEITGKIVRIEMEELKVIGEKLSAAGFSMMLDNYDSEITNLPALDSMRFKGIKLGRGITSGIADRFDVRAEAENIIKIVKTERGMIAEAVGIETTKQYLTMRQSGCTIGQGIYFSKPLPPDEFEAYYKCKKQK